MRDKLAYISGKEDTIQVSCDEHEPLVDEDRNSSYVKPLMSFSNLFFGVSKNHKKFMKIYFLSGSFHNRGGACVITILLLNDYSELWFRCSFCGRWTAIRISAFILTISNRLDSSSEKDG